MAPFGARQPDCANRQNQPTSPNRERRWFGEIGSVSEGERLRYLAGFDITERLLLQAQNQLTRVTESKGDAFH